MTKKMTKKCLKIANTNSKRQTESKKNDKEMTKSLFWIFQCLQAQDFPKINTNKIVRVTLGMYYGTPGQQSGASVQFMGVSRNMYD